MSVPERTVIRKRATSGHELRTLARHSTAADPGSNTKMEAEVRARVEPDAGREPRDGRAVPAGRVVSLIAVAYAGLSLYLSLELNVWRDEMYSLHTSAYSPWLAARQALAFELQPPLYFALLSLWRMMNASVVFARMFSTLFCVGTIFVAASLSRRFFPKTPPGWFAAVLATHPFLVWAGSEIRVYALAIFLSSLLAFTSYEAHWGDESSVARRVACVCVAVLSLYTQYYLGVLLLCFLAALAVRGDRVRTRRFVFDMVIVGVLVLPLFFAARAQIDAHASDLGPHLSSGESGFRTLVTRFEELLFSWNQFIDQSRWSASAVRIARWTYRATIAVVVAFLFWGGRPVDWVRARTSAPLFVMVFVYAVAMLVLFRVAGPWAVGSRHVAGLFVPATLMLLAFPALGLGEGALRAWALFLVAGNLVTVLSTQVLPLAKDCDCRRVAAALSERESPGEPILVFPSEDAMPLAVYYRGANVLVPIPRPASLEHWDQQSFVIENPEQVGAALENTAKDPSSLWVHTSDYGDRWGRGQLEAFLAHGYRENGRSEFARGVTLRHFVRSGPSPR